MSLKLSDEEKESLSYDDVAYLILKEANKKIKVADLFKKVLKAMGLSEEEFASGIGDFFEEVMTDKRLIVLDGGYCDLKINHASKIVIEDEEEEYEVATDEEIEDEEEENIDQIDEDNYDDDLVDESDDGLDDLVIIDESEDGESELM